MRNKLKNFLKLKIIRILVVILMPIVIIFIFTIFITIVIGCLKLAYLHLPGEEIGVVGDWIGFIGSTLGIIAAVIGISWQLKENRKSEERERKEKKIEKELGALRYFKYLLENIKIPIKRSKESSIVYFSFERKKLSIDSQKINFFMTNLEEKMFIEMFPMISSKKYGYIFFDIIDSIDSIDNILNKNLNNMNLRNKLFKKIKKEVEENIKEKVLIDLINEIQKKITKLDMKNIDYKKAYDEMEEIKNYLFEVYEMLLQYKKNIDFFYIADEELDIFYMHTNQIYDICKLYKNEKKIIEGGSYTFNGLEKYIEEILEKINNDIKELEK